MRISLRFRAILRSTKQRFSALTIGRYCIPFFLLFALANDALGQEKKTEKQLQQLKATIEALRKELESTKSSRNEIQKSLESSEKAVGELSKKAESLKKELKENQSTLKELRDERSQLEEQKREQQASVSGYINSAYRLGQQSQIRLLLNQQQPDRVARNLKYYNYFADARAEKIGSFVKTINRIDQIEPEIAYKTAAIESNYASLKQQQKKLKGAQVERKKILAKLNSSISNKAQELDQLSRDRKALEKVLASVINSIDDVRIASGAVKFANLKGKLPWPAQGRVLKQFGNTRVANKMRWQGMLIKSNAGSPVKAVHYGRVVFSDYLRGHGLLVIIDHGAGYMSLYAHNQTIYKELGEWVESGETIASVGNSGGQKQTALYFELRYKGQPTNPKRWFKAA